MTAESLRAQRIVRASVAAILGTAVWYGGMESALAQQAAARDDELAEVQVTGTRILRRDLESTSPLVTIGEETFNEISNVGVEAALNKLPQFFPGLDQFDTADIQLSSNSTVGATNVNLRNLGANRNLVLINGRRAVPVNATMVTDTSSIPSAALSRVEIITGGASSVYGADAVGGVVNFILRENFQGIDIDAQHTQTEFGDNRQTRIAALIGGNFADDRGNAMFGAEYTERGEVLAVDRPFFREQLMSPDTAGGILFNYLNRYAANTIINGTANLPSQAVVNAIFNQAPPGTVANTSTFAVNADGSLFTYSDSNNAAIPGDSPSSGAYRYNGGYDIFRKQARNGSISENYLGQRISSPLHRWSLFGSAHYDITDSLTAYVQATFSQAETESIFDVTAAAGTWGSLVPYGTQRNCDTIGYRINGQQTTACQDTDPLPASLSAGGTRTSFAQVPTAALYLAGGAGGLACPALGGCTNSQAFPVPPELAQLLDSRPNANADWALNQSLIIYGENRGTKNESTNYQTVLGFRGDLPVKDWTWDIYGSHGTSRTNANLTGLVAMQRFRQVLRMPNYGRGATLAGNPGPPGNNNNAPAITCTSGLPIFESFEISEDCRTATQVRAMNVTKMDQNMVEAVMQGGLFELPAGELRFALGADYRENVFSFTPDNLLSQGAFTDSVVGLDPISATANSENVKEGYAELLIPVLKDLPGFTHLNLELGYRYSDYKNTGPVSTWKALLDWAFTPDLRLRGGVQRANRSPNLGELFQKDTDTFGFFGSPGEPCGIGFALPYGANPATNRNGAEGAARVAALCEQLMGPTGYANFITTPGYTAVQGPFGSEFYKLSGNPDAKSEVANTLTAGLVFRSPFVSPVAQFTTSLDYYHIEVKDAINAPSLFTLYEQCYSEVYNTTMDPNNPSCQLLTRDQNTGAKNRARVMYSNVGVFETSGMDLSFNWSAALSDMGLQSLPGRVSYGLAANYTFYNRRQDAPTVPVRDNTGYVGFDFPWQAFSTFGYSNGGFNASLRWRHYPGALNFARQSNPASLTQGVRHYDLWDLSASYFFGRNLSIRGGIDNLLDKEPPINGFNPGAGGPGTTGYARGMIAQGSVYDVLGRSYYLGVKMTF